MDPMIPLRVEAYIPSGVTLPPGGGLALDGLLAWSVASELGLVAGFGPPIHVDIPVAWEPKQRFHLATYAIHAGVDATESRYTNKRPVLAEAQLFGDDKFKRMHIGAGLNKGYRIPGEIAYVADDLLTWFCVGELEGIKRLLSNVTHLGKRRGSGRGSVHEWRVVECEPWSPAFPLMRAGKPLRALPLDWPGLVEPDVREAVLTYPYWEHRRAVPCAVPS